MTRIAGVDYPVRIASDEVLVKRSRLATLENKERAHDDYLIATRLMGQRIREHIIRGDDEEWHHGYRTCLRDFCQLVVDVSGVRDELS